MEIEETTFNVAGENVRRIEQGTIFDLVIEVKRKIKFENGTIDQAYFTATFNRNTADGQFNWTSTTDRSDSDAFGDQHVIATHEAADYVAEHYGAVDRGQLE